MTLITPHFDAACPESARYESHPDMFPWGPHLTNRALCVDFDAAGQPRSLNRHDQASRIAVLLQWLNPELPPGSEPTVTLGTYWVASSWLQDSTKAEWLVPHHAEDTGTPLLLSHLKRIDGQPAQLRIALPPGLGAHGEQTPGRIRFGADEGALTIAWETTEFAPLVQRRSADDYVLQWPAGGDHNIFIAVHWGSDALPTYSWDRDQAATAAFFHQTLSTARVLTSRGDVNRSLNWASVDILRSVYRYPAGLGVSNNLATDYLVCRDTAWIAMGLAYRHPAWSREILKTLQPYCLPNGMMVEYVRGRDGTSETYGLDVLDNTPLYVIASEHVARTTRDQSFARALYPTVTRCLQNLERHLASHPNHLIATSAEGTANWGICSWRNVIPGYVLDGAVTEINVECLQAFRSGSKLAGWLGDDPMEEHWNTRADELSHAISHHLKTGPGRFVRNIDSQGHVHSGLTGDIVFPMLWADLSADDILEMRRQMMAHLLTGRGVRTIPEGDREYHPTGGFGLLGGVWPDLSIWWAKALLDHGFVEDAWMLFQATAAIPEEARSANAVPGEYPEWFCGASGVNRGMYLSPWVAPKLTWLWMAGFLGLTVDSDAVAVNPQLPKDLSWSLWDRIELGPDQLSVWADAARHQLFTSMPVSAPGWAVVVLGPERLTDDVQCTSPDWLWRLYGQEGSTPHVVVASLSVNPEPAVLTIGQIPYELSPRERGPIVFQVE